MISSAVFARYARALADVAVEMGQAAAVERDLQLYGEIFRAVPDLLTAFDSPAVPRDAKEKLLSELLDRYPVCQISSNFLRVLLGHYRLRYFHEVQRQYVKTVNDRKGIVTAQVRSAALLTGGELTVLRERLARAMGKEVTLEIQADAELLGGLIVQIGSTVYDGSVRSHLEEMRRSLIGG